MFFIPFGFLQETAAFGFLLAGSSAASDPEFRGLHDRFAGTVVVRVPEYSARSDPLRSRKRR